MGKRLCAPLVFFSCQFTEERGSLFLVPQLDELRVAEIGCGGGWGAIAVTYVEWAGTALGQVLVPWRRIHDGASANAFADDAHCTFLRESSNKEPAQQAIAEKYEVIAYLEAENAYAARMLEPMAGLRQTLIEEMKSRIKPDDESVPYREGEYWYYYRYAEGHEYPVYCRRKGSLDAEEQDR